jgi:uncharacterized membrane protein (DUF4010 family)
MNAAGLDAVAGIIVATLGGAAVGVERQRSGKAAGPLPRFAGIRTFTLLGALSGVAGRLAAEGQGALATVIAAGAVLLTISAYVATSRHDVDATTEVAGIVVIAAGLFAGLGHLGISAGLTASTVLLLAEKTRLHALVERLDEATMLAATRFAVMSIVVLPLLPEGPYGPAPGVRPRDLWLLVLLFSGLSFAGFIGRRLTGGSGYPLAGLLGGLISSTSVTLTFARLSRVDREHDRALAAGVVAASTILYIRLAVAVAILNGTLLPVLGPYLAVPFAVGLVALAITWRTLGAPAEEGTVADPFQNPLQLRAALEMALLFQVVLFGVHFARQFLGARGLLASGFVLGLTDMDALTISMARSAAAGVPLDLAARAIAVGIVANTLLKIVIALAVGRGRFAWQATVPMAAMGVALGLMVAG